MAKPTYEQMRAENLRYLNGHVSPNINYYQEICMQATSVEMHYDISEEQDKIPLHSHTFYEILFCDGGNVQYLLGKDSYRLQQGDIILIPPGMSHRPLFPEILETPYKRFALWISAACFEQAAQTYPDFKFAFSQCEKRGSYLLRSSRATWAGLYTAFNQVWEETQAKRIGWRLCMEMTSLVLMMHISRTYFYQDVSVPLAEHEGLADDIFGFIDANLSENLTLESISHHFLVSKSTVSHLFQKQLGLSFYQCVIQRRLIAAKNLMLQRTPLREVWERFGFADYSSFFRLFKKEYGVSPRQFRTLNGANEKEREG